MTIHSIVIQKLLSTNAQLGRRVAAHHFKVYTYGLRNKMAIIDSDKTLICMRSACNFIASLARQKGRLMFVNTNPLFNEIFEQMTQKIEFFRPIYNDLWRARGSLTNSLSPKKFRSRHKKLTFGPVQPPDCVVVIDTEKKCSILNEADKLKIPIVALVDSSMPLVDYQRIAYPIPANASVQFVYLFCNLITKTLLLEQKKLARAVDELEDREEVQSIEEGKNKVGLAKKEVAVISYADLASLSDDVEETKKLLDRLAVLKFNGALGTNMGLEGPKSSIDICDGTTFLDSIVNQIETLNLKYGCRVPLILLNTVDTHDNTLKVLEKYSESSIGIHAFKQGEGPDLKSSTANKEEEVYSLENGSVLLSLLNDGTLDLLLSQGKEYILLLDADNVATIIDPKILKHLMENNIEYCMEVLPNYSFDLNSGPSMVKLLEIGRYSDKPLKDDFKLVDTANRWVNLRAIKRLVNTGRLTNEILCVSKEKDNDQAFLQETAAGSAIQFFDNAVGISIPESRFHPLNATSDLLLLKSDLYTFRDGVLTRNPARTNPLNPTIRLGHEFAKVGDFQSRFRSIPSIVELDNLTVSGDVWFGANITLKGRVTIFAKPGTRLEIPDGVVIENKENNDPADI
ncbi:hypothetical protein L6164_000244 [Bauhinia variegata]|uniref:Uncharacterized protein n=1 Tax=Bauhinia variegata TaxID=167791 RepID=A0ACB9Q547_BAUVA|nr:hypothetical protein L6164_000244 [Bauhinia variegata]